MIRRLREFALVFVTCLVFWAVLFVALAFAIGPRCEQMRHDSPSAYAVRCGGDR